MLTRRPPNIAVWDSAILEDGSCWLCVLWDPLEPNYELVRIQNPAVKLDQAKKEVVTARTFVIPAQAIANSMANGQIRWERSRR